MLVLQAQRQIIPYDYFVFSNVGDDSENPATLAYIEQYIKPFAAAHGIPLIEVRHKRETLLEHIYRTKRSVPIPARTSNGKPGNRSCTVDFKIKIIDRWVRSNAYTHAVVGIGFSTDEFHRVRSEIWYDHEGTYRPGFWKRREHQLIDLRLSRHRCVELVVRAGLPIPPKSSCWFCPYTRRAEWVEMRRERPELFEKAVALEQHINLKRESLDKDRVYLHSAVRPLDQAVGMQDRLFSDEDMDACEEGHCLT